MAARDLAALTLASLIAGLLAGPLAGSVQAQACGDCDGNGFVNILDALTAARHDAGLAIIQSPEFELCNVEGVPGGAPPAVVSVLDALAIARYMAGLTPPLSCSAPPACTITTPSPPAPAGTVLVDYQAADAHSRPVDLTAEFSSDAGVSFAPASQGAGGDPMTGLSTSPVPGERHTFAWDSAADGAGPAGAQAVLVRLTLTHAGGSGSCTTASFDVDNRPPPQCIPHLNDGHVYRLVHDPLDPLVVYAGTCGGGIYRSTDAGATWTEINQGLHGSWVTSIAIHPTTTSRLWVTLADDRTVVAPLYRSTDSGATWAHHGTGLPAHQPGHWIMYHPGDLSGNRMFVSIGDAGVLRSMDGGATWIPSSGGLPASRAARILAGGAFNPNTAWAAVSVEGVYRTNDGGVSWSPVNSGLPGTHDPVALVASPSVASNVWVAITTAPYVYRSVSSGNWWAATSGVPDQPRSLAVCASDQSILWAACGRGMLCTSSNWGIAWTTLGAGLTDDEAHAVAIDPGTPGNLVMGGHRGTHISADTGVTWTRSDAHLSATMPRAVAYDPTDLRRMYMGTCVPGSSNGCIWRSSDGGTSWTFGLTDPACSDVRDIVVDPAAPATVFACVGGSGLHVSTDSGATWAPRTTGMPGSGTCVRMAVDPTDLDTIYIAHDVDECFATTDGGGSWIQVSSGITGASAVTDMAMHPADPLQLLLATDGEGLYRTTDGAASWTQVTTGLVNLQISALGYAASNPAIVYCASGAPTAQQVHRSTDGGVTWATVGPHLGVSPSQIRCLAVDPSDHDKVYVGTTHGGLWRSADGGQTWAQENTGLVSHHVGYVGFHPTSPSTVLIGSAQGLTTRTF